MRPFRTPYPAGGTRHRPGRRSPARWRRGVTAAMVAVLATAAAALPAQAAAPGGIYTGLDGCPVNSAVMKDPTHLQVGCMTSTTNGGSMTIGSHVVPITSPIRLQFGVYWDASAPVVDFPSGTTANVYRTVPPSKGQTLTSKPIEVDIPGIGNIIPGVTSVYADVELAGPITEFVPLAAGEPHPAFVMPIKLHLYNALFGLKCYIGSDRAPIVLRPTTGTTSPPPPAGPISGDPGVIGIEADPNGHETIVASFTDASLVDNSLAVPRANGCGLLGTLDPLINLVFGLPSAAGHNAVVFSDTDVSLAISPSLADLTSALAASS
ncbi:hypothetical protein [Melissospora conviva]|uniref:hypothetical protein n=1 Tax=Melissospora conviva TaxID=3388432 RepID=UPI003B7B5D0B